MFVQQLVEGAIIHFELVFFPSVYPMRALLKGGHTVAKYFEFLKLETTVLSLFEKVTEVFSVNPFVEQIPYVLDKVTIHIINGKWFIIDILCNSITLSNDMDSGWICLSVTQGEPFSCFGLYENESFNIHSVWAENKYYSLR